MSNTNNPKLEIGTVNSDVVIFTNKQAYIYISFDQLEEVIADMRRAKSDALVSNFLTKRVELKA